METNADAPADQEPLEIGSEDWVERTLGKLGSQGAEPEDYPERPEPQDEETTTETPSEAATDNADAQKEIPKEPVAAPTWREATIPEDDENVPKHFRGKRVDDVWTSYRQLERTWNEQQQKLRELEARVAAKETFKELLAEQAAASKPQEQPSDPYAEAGFDIETAPVLRPQEFFPKQEEIILSKAQKLVNEELQKREEAQRQQAAVNAEVEAVSAALEQVRVQRNLDPDIMQKKRLPSIMMAANAQKVEEALSQGYTKEQATEYARQFLRDPNYLLSVHDDIFGAPAPSPVVDVTPQTAPSPPGVKRSTAVEPAAKPTGPQLKSYEREILGELASSMQNALRDPNDPSKPLAIDPDRLAARYAANLKRQRS